jgi:hypothetical protein
MRGENAIGALSEVEGHKLAEQVEASVEIS